ncbi:MAG: hypothetical protein EOO06_07840 [Chitinophagaceae bacterium]|nr:MAG: hypothetical protein EOO06_07840 [Chitinophagaceae bacterium]
MAVKKDSSNIITASLPLEEISPRKKRKKTIYLTFDDGPNKGTKNVIDIINDEEVPATLFVIGEHVYGSRLQAAVYDSVRNSAFVELANHSFTHAHNKFSRFYASPDNVVNDFKRCADSLSLSSNIIRTPGRNIWRLNDIKQTDNKESAGAADALAKNGYIVMGWDLEWHYNDQLQAVQSYDQLAAQIDSMFTHNRTRTADHLVLLAHDQVYSNKKDSTSLRQLVSRLKGKGDYDFAFINSYPGIEKLPILDSSLLKK